MTLTERLLKADIKKAYEKETKKIKSKHLAKILGEQEPIEIMIQEIDSRRLNDILALQFDKKGKFDMSKSFDAKLVTCLDGIIDPPMKSQELKNHFLPGGGTPKDLVELLFGPEVNSISDEIVELSGMTSEETDQDGEKVSIEDEVKN